MGKIRRQRNPLFSSKFPSSSMQGEIRRQRNPLFSTKFPGEISRGNLEDKSVCMGNEGNT
jgi:hypothetical protein